MTNRERVNAILHYEDYDRFVVVHIGYWKETLLKWAQEGHIPKELANGIQISGDAVDAEVGRRLGFDFNINTQFRPIGFKRLNPLFDYQVIREFPDGSKHSINEEGVIVLEKPGAQGIPAEIGYTLKDRITWEKHYKPRLQFSSDIINKALVKVDNRLASYKDGGKEFLQKNNRDFAYGLFAGSVIGSIRNWLGLENFSYLYADDPSLFREIVDISAELDYQTVKTILNTGAKFEYIHFWEDICFKNGPLFSPATFKEIAGPYYRRIAELSNSHDIDIITVDCDGLIDKLIPTWIDNGVNTMWPVEVGTWNASIKPWRENYGKDLRAIGGMRKAVFAQDKIAIDQEIERLKPLVELGGYIPCPDHHIPPDAEWDNVRYYCDKMHKVWG